MDFEEQLKGAIRRGSQQGEKARQSERAMSLSKEELKSRHTGFRLTLSEHIEENLRKVGNHIPGFQYETIYGERGWGGAISRDDLLKGGSFYSRLEITVRNLNEYGLLTLVGKGTVRNREVVSWNHFAEIVDVDLDAFRSQIDRWILEYVEKFSGS